LYGNEQLHGIVEFSKYLEPEERKEGRMGEIWRVYFLLSFLPSEDRNKCIYAIELIISIDSCPNPEG